MPPPPPPPYYSQPPPPVGPPTPRHEQWGRSDSGGISVPPPALIQQAPSIPPPAGVIPAPMQTSRPRTTGSQGKKPAQKPASILVAEIVLALLVVVTLTIGGCLLLQSR
jgi:hypothetical protein